MSGSDVCHFQVDAWELVHELSCSLFLLSRWSAVIQIEAVPSLGPRARRGRAEPQLTYSGHGVRLRSNLCFDKPLRFCGCLSSYFISLEKRRPRYLIHIEMIMSNYNRKNDLAYADCCTPPPHHHHRYISKQWLEWCFQTYISVCCSEHLMTPRRPGMRPKVPSFRLLLIGLPLWRHFLPLSSPFPSATVSSLLSLTIAQMLRSQGLCFCPGFCHGGLCPDVTRLLLPFLLASV